MRLLARTFILLLASYNVFSDSPDIEEAFKSFMIVPATLSAAPESLLTLRFGDKLVKLGNVFEPAEVAWPPILSYEAEPSELYTVLILDVFYANFLPANTISYLLLMVVNTPGNNIIIGDVVSPYIPPSPIPGTGYHSYVYLVYKQPCRIDTSTQDILDIPTHYTNFCLPEFTSRYNLSSPVAGNFFISRATACYSKPPKKLSKCS